MLTLALAGNPNVGKSTVFNSLTGAHQHTGNWAGKTVDTAQGIFKSGNEKIKLVDLPGTYSLSASSDDEKCAAEYICFSQCDGIIVVCDATCLERNLILALQILEITGRVVICLNLMDEAEKKHIVPNPQALSQELGGASVIPVSAAKGVGMAQLRKQAKSIGEARLKIYYGEEMEAAVEIVTKALKNHPCGDLNQRWLALRLLEENDAALCGAKKYLGYDIASEKDVSMAVGEAREYLAKNNIPPESIRAAVMKAIADKARQIKTKTVTENAPVKKEWADKIFTGKILAVPTMLALLLCILYLTCIGANYPSAVLTALFARWENVLWLALGKIGVGSFLKNLIARGMFRVLGWVVSVMLPPMAIFFPLFTLLEDLGYLPRVAFNLDCAFRKCGACGKQALTTCMGLGCNAVGVSGCRIIDSPKEKIMAMLTNCFIPCNGRLPSIIAVAGIFFASGGFFEALTVTGVMVFGVLVTFVVCALLRKTVLKGMASSFTLELPPYRRPKILQTLVRSVLDRTVYVLGRAAAVAAPAGIIIWLMANIRLGGTTILNHGVNLLDPLGRLMGLDGEILLGFVLGFPANEIVLPIVLMCYCGGNVLTDYQSADFLGDILLQNGWSRITALCFVIFTLCHFPCSTTLWTIYKETKSIRWSVWSVILPLLTGIVLTVSVNFLFKFISIFA